MSRGRRKRSCSAFAVWLTTLMAVMATAGLLGALVKGEDWRYWLGETVWHVGVACLAYTAFDMSKKLTKLREAAEDVECKAQKVIEQAEKLPPRKRPGGSAGS